MSEISWHFFIQVVTPAFGFKTAAINLTAQEQNSVGHPSLFLSVRLHHNLTFLSHLIACSLASISWEAVIKPQNISWRLLQTLAGETEGKELLAAGCRETVVCWCWRACECWRLN